MNTFVFDKVRQNIIGDASVIFTLCGCDLSIICLSLCIDDCSILRWNAVSMNVVFIQYHLSFISLFVQVIGFLTIVNVRIDFAYEKFEVIYLELVVLFLSDKRIQFCWNRKMLLIEISIAIGVNLPLRSLIKQALILGL